MEPPHTIAEAHPKRYRRVRFVASTFGRDAWHPRRQSNLARACARRARPELAGVPDPVHIRVIALTWGKFWGSFLQHFKVLSHFVYNRGRPEHRVNARFSRFLRSA